MNCGPGTAVLLTARETAFDFGVEEAAFGADADFGEDADLGPGADLGADTDFKEDVDLGAGPGFGADPDFWAGAGGGTETTRELCRRGAGERGGSWTDGFVGGGNDSDEGLRALDLVNGIAGRSVAVSFFCGW